MANSLRSPIGRARGLGSAKEGVGHWWAQRLTAVALVPLTLWFVFAVLTLLGQDYDAAVAWEKNPFNAVLALSLIFASFYHAALGLQVVVEDYVSERWRLVTIVAIKFVLTLLGLSAVLFVLKVAIGG